MGCGCSAWASARRVAIAAIAAVATLVVLDAIALLFPSPSHRAPRAAPSSSSSAASARRTTSASTSAPASASSPLPDEWSWALVDDAQAAAWPFAEALPPGTYATRVQDQHRSGWCGCCYLIAVVHMMQDRWNVLVGTRLAAGERMLPFVELDAQAMLDDYHRHRHAVHAGWNACQGGEPKRVLACMVEGGCPLRVAPARGYAWRGHPMRGDDESEEEEKEEEEGEEGRRRGGRHGGGVLGGGGGRRGPRVASFRIVPNREADVRAALWERGSVVLTIDAECIAKADARGVADVSERRRRNHAVTVIGWTHAVPAPDEHGEPGRATCCYIVRNSWGDASAPSNLPEDLRCVRAGANECDEQRRAWTGAPDLPGHVFLPAWYVHREGDADSPWYEGMLDLDGADGEEEEEEEEGDEAR